MPSREMLLEAHRLQFRRRKAVLRNARAAQKPGFLVAAGVDHLKPYAGVILDLKLQHNGIIEPDRMLICSAHAELGDQDAAFLHLPVR